MTERKLARLFDYQKFAGNSKLQAVIDAAHHQAQDLSVDDLEMFAAAGDPFQKSADEKKDKLFN